MAFFSYTACVHAFSAITSLHEASRIFVPVGLTLAQAVLWAATIAVFCCCVNNAAHEATVVALVGGATVVALVGGATVVVSSKCKFCGSK